MDFDKLCYMHKTEKEALWELQKSIEYLTYVTERQIDNIQNIKEGLTIASPSSKQNEQL